MAKEEILYFELHNQGRTVMEKNIPTSQKLDMVNDALLDAKTEGVKLAINIIVKYYEKNLQFTDTDNCCQQHARENFLDMYTELYTLLQSFSGKNS